MHFIFTEDGWTGIAGRMDVDDTLLSIGGDTKVMIIWDNIHEAGFRSVKSNSVYKKQYFSKRKEIFHYTGRSISIYPTFAYFKSSLWFLFAVCHISYLFIICILYSQKTAGRGSLDGWTWTTRFCPLVEIPR